ncbi:MAG: methylated-DNA--[protein]-cysteine S-methyltransferase [Gammaproteobacteria bacterium]
MYYQTVSSPVGELLLAGDDAALHLIHFQAGPRPMKPETGWQQDARLFREVLRQLKAYFAGKLRQFDLPLKPEGTAFQMRVWRALRTIPYGETWSYGQLARRIGKPAASRAVGAANGQNPIPIIVPCHRVIGADGSLTGFGGGLSIKQKLLELESGERHLLL